MDTNIIRKRARAHEAVIAAKLTGRIAARILAQFRDSIDEICQELELGQFRVDVLGFPGEKLARHFVQKQLHG